MLEFSQRRHNLMAKLGEDAMLVIASANEQIRSRDTYFPFRQNSDFHYLTGFPEPEALAVLLPGKLRGKYILFSRGKDLKLETWQGRLIGQTGACQDFDADEAHDIKQLDKLMPALLQTQGKIYFHFNNDSLSQQIRTWLLPANNKVNFSSGLQYQFIDLAPSLNEMRLIKSSQEIHLMQYAAQISAEAHCQAMKLCHSNQFEYQIEAEIVNHFNRNDCRSPAYNTIVASGDNACILHYVANNAPLQKDQLLLVDAGAEYQGYAADITRTYPINGRFNCPQQAIYELVLAAQLAAIAQAVPGKPWGEMHKAAEKILTQGLIDLKLLKGRLADLLEKQAAKRFYLHQCGHWLGLDVHDVGAYKIDNKWRPLQKSMAFTVEPGIYIPQGMKNVDEKWWGIGVRIEDDVILNENGPEIISAGVPKTIEGIQQLMSEKL